MKCDLHFHSFNSDGELQVKEIIDILVKEKVLFACLTDHDTLMGTEEFLKLAKNNNILSFPSLELSTKRNKESIHIVAYFKDYNNIPSSFKDYLDSMRKQRFNRMKMMTDNVNKLYNLDIDFEKIAKLHPNTLERPHLAEQICDKLGITQKEAFEKYIGNDCPAYIPATDLPYEEGIKMIHEAGGLAILAHPYQYKKNKQEELINMGVDGVEVFYYPTPKKHYKKYLKIVKKMNLLATGGSDFHRILDYRHSPLGNDEVPSPYIDDFIKAIENL